jgi:hypothetical protein
MMEGYSSAIRQVAGAQARGHQTVCKKPLMSTVFDLASR